MEDAANYTTDKVVAVTQGPSPTPPVNPIQGDAEFDDSIFGISIRVYEVLLYVLLAIMLIEIVLLLFVRITRQLYNEDFEALVNFQAGDDGFDDPVLEVVVQDGNIIRPAPPG